MKYKKTVLVIISLSFLACIVFVICFFTTSPKEHQNASMFSSDTSPIQVQIHEQQNELAQMLLDYDKDNIVKVSVVLQDSDNEVPTANILIVSKDEITNADEQDEIMTFVSDYLNLDAHNIYLEYTDIEMEQNKLKF